MKRIFPLALITLGVLLSLGALGRLYLNNRAGSLEIVELPDELVGLQITESRRGAEAMAEFADLHGKRFQISSGAVGIYGNGQITLWVAATDSPSLAAQLTSAMQVKIAEGNSPFTPVDEISNGRRTIYVLEGMGQRHYYFLSKNLVIWMAADRAVADNALQQTLEVYP